MCSDGSKAPPRPLPLSFLCMFFLILDSRPIKILSVWDVMKGRLTINLFDHGKTGARGRHLSSTLRNIPTTVKEHKGRWGGGSLKMTRKRVERVRALCASSSSLAFKRRVLVQPSLWKKNSPETWWCAYLVTRDVVGLPVAAFRHKQAAPCRAPRAPSGGLVPKRKEAVGTWQHGKRTAAITPKTATATTVPPKQVPAECPERRVIGCAPREKIGERSAYTATICNGGCKSWCY